MPGNAINISITGESATFNQTSQKVQGELAKIGQQVEHLKKQGGSSFFDGIRESLGKKSALGEGAELLKGAGPIKGLTAAVEVAAEFSKGIDEANEKLRTGEITAADYPLEIAKSIPVIGSMESKLEDIAELWTHNKRDLAEANAENKLMDDLIKGMRESWARMAEETAKWNTELAEAEQRIKTLQMPDESAPEKLKKSQQESIDAEAEHLHKLDEEAAQKKKQAEAALAPLQAEMRAAQAKARTALSAAGGDTDDAGFQTAAREANLANRAVTDVQKQAKAEQANIDAIYEGKKTEYSKEQASKRADAANKSENDNLKAITDAASKQADDIKAIQDKTLADQLEAQGKHLEAFKVMQDSETDAKIKAINKQAADDKTRFNSDDKENMDRIDKQAKAQIDAINAQNAAKLDAEKQKLDEKDVQAGIEDENQQAAEYEKKAQAAQKYMDVSPAQKYSDELAKINQLKKDGLLTDAQAAAAVAKQNQELANSLPQAESRKVGAETRRFDFNIGKTEKLDPMEQMKNQQKAQLDSAKKAEFYLQQLYNQGLAAPTTVQDWGA